MSNNIEIIAELAQGFEGKPEQTFQLLRAAAASGADAAKFQLVYADELATPDYKYYDLFKDLEMDNQVWEELIKISKELSIEVIFDIFGGESLALAEKLGGNTVMLHATDMTNLELIKEVSKCSMDRVILGAGGAHLSEIESALNLLKNKQVYVMLGFQGYPTPDGHNQISRINHMSSWVAEKYNNVVIGFADHSLPDSKLLTSFSSMAYSAGARIFEKHLTLSQVMKLEDYESAINPDQFFDYCYELKECVKAYGVTENTQDFGMSSSEKKYRKFVQRHIIAIKDLKRGSVITKADIKLGRSPNDAAITDIKKALGKKLLKDFKKNQAFSESDLG
jgi:N,N'-diacetyllegionaminate synthase